MPRPKGMDEVPADVCRARPVAERRERLQARGPVTGGTRLIDGASGLRAPLQVGAVCRQNPIVHSSPLLTIVAPALAPGACAHPCR